MKKLIVSLICTFLLINFTFAQWQALKAPEGGNVKDLFYFNNKLFAFGYYGQIYTSEDSGYVWSEYNSPQLPLGVYSQPQKLFNIDQTIYALYSRNIYYTHNNGITWNILPLNNFIGLDTSNSNLNAIETNNSNEIIIYNSYSSVPNACLYKLTQTGLSITVQNITNIFPEEPNGIISITKNTNKFFAYGANNKAYRLDLNLTNVEEITLPASNYMGICGYKNSLFYHTYNYTIFKSDDNGSSFTEVTSDFTINGISPVKLIATPNYLFSIGNVYGYTDDGTNWYPIFSSSGQPNTVNDIYEFNDLFTLSINSNGGISHIYNSLNDIDNNQSGISQSENYFLKIIQNNLVCAGYGDNGAYKSNDAGTSWNKINNGWINKGFYKLYTNNDFAVGTTWHNAGVPVYSIDTLSTLNSFSNWASTGNYGNIIAFDNDTVYASNNVGQIFKTNINDNFFISCNGNLPIISAPYVVKSLNNHNVWAIQEYSGNIYRSVNGGLSWILSRNGLSPTNGCYSPISDGKDLFAVNAFNGLLMKFNYALNKWVNASGGLSAGLQYLNIIDRNGMKFLLTYSSFYVSIDGGLTWQALNNGLPVNIDNRDLACDSNYIYISASGKNIYRLSLNDPIFTAFVECNNNAYNNTICIGQEVTFTANGATTYQFFINDTAVTTLSNNNTFTVSNLQDGDRVYVVGYSGFGSGQSTTDTFVVLNQAIPNVTLNTPNGIVNFCTTDSVELVPGGANSYQLFINQSSFTTLLQGDTISLLPGSNTSYYVLGTDGNNCKAKSNVLNIHIRPDILPDVLPICMVTVDTTSTKNVIIWQNPVTGLNNVSAYKVYRNVVGNYTHIATVQASTLNLFEDTTTGINPNITQYRYKLSIVDSCNNESPLSLYHQTIWLDEPFVNGNGSIKLTWQNYSIENTNLTTDFYYRIEMDTTGANNWTPIDSVSNGILIYTHLSPPFSSTLRYRVVIVVPDGCDPTRARIATSRSNIKNTSRLTSINHINSPIEVTPNPTKGFVTITLSNNYETHIYLTDLSGRTIYDFNTTKNKLTLDLNNLSQGIYYLTTTDHKGTSISKIIKL